jgi:hypothetical protein
MGFAWFASTYIDALTHSYLTLGTHIQAISPEFRQIFPDSRPAVATSAALCQRRLTARPDSPKNSALLPEHFGAFPGK